MQRHSQRLPQRSNLILTAYLSFLLILTLSLVGCEKSSSGGKSGAGTTPQELVRISGQVKSDDEALSLVPDAKVVLIAENGADTPLQVESIADTSGEYALTFDKAQLPDHFLLQAEAEGYVPYDLDVEKETLTEAVDIDILLQPLQDNMSVLKPVSSLHHLGDNLFNGAPNSQFQTAVAGKVFEMTFTLTEEQLTAKSAEIQLMVKGCEANNPLLINDLWLANLADCASDGSYSQYLLQVEMGYFSSISRLRIESMLNVQSGDFDNFEFGNIVLEFRYD